MFCSKCGNEMNAEAAVCIKCGVPAGKGNNYCPNCGAQPHPEAVICVNCGVALNTQQTQTNQSTTTTTATPGAKSKLVAGLLAIFLGSFGVHNFYLGFTGKAVAQLLITVLTCGAGSVISAIWALVEGIMILTGKNNTDGKGNLLGE